MPMPQEIEVKFKVEDFGRVRRALRKAGAKYLGTVLQTDTYFDTPGRMLLRGDRGLRIRKVRCLRRGSGAIDTRPQLTYKGAAHTSRVAKIRREIQTHFDDEEALIRVFGACGLEATATVRKRRASYRLGRCLVELDERPGLGRYVEIEGPDEKRIHAAARKLALEGEPITDHYVNMLARA